MVDITEKSFKVTGYRQDGSVRFCEIEHDIMSVGRGVTQMLDLDGVVRVITEVEDAN